MTDGVEGPACGSVDVTDCDGSCWGGFFESETLRRAGLYPALRNAARADLRRSLSSIPAPASFTSVNCDNELGVLNSLYLINVASDYSGSQRIEKLVTFSLR